MNYEFDEDIFSGHMVSQKFSIITDIFYQVMEGSNRGSRSKIILFRIIQKKHCRHTKR